MSVKTTLVAAELALLLLSQLSTAQGNLVVNGTFTGGADGWALSNGSFYQSVQGNPGGCVVLDSVSPSASTDPSATQTVAGLSSGLPYAVSGQYASAKDRAAGSYPNTSFGVAIGGSLMFEALAPTNSAWQAFAFSFIATSSSAVLTLSSQMHGTGLWSSVDNIVLQPIPSLAGSVVGTNIVLMWPTNVAGFVLQTSTNLSNTSSWLNVTNGVVVAGSNRTVTTSATRPDQYFRLKL